MPFVWALLRSEAFGLPYWGDLVYNLKCVSKGQKSVVISEILLRVKDNKDVDGEISQWFVDDPTAIQFFKLDEVVDTDVLKKFKLVYWGTVCAQAKTT